ncbi:MAG: energy transducer TonB [Puia sp.]
MIECGYIDNPSDLKYLQDEKNQEKIARDILEAIKKYSLATSIPASETSPAETGIQSKQLTQASNTEINESVSDSSGPLRKVEEDAEYPGDAKGWQAYLFKNLSYPQAAVSNEVQGKVIVEFIVNTDGSISKVHAISGPKELRAESVRVIKESGHWVPARNKGAKVASYKKQPIVYKLESK